MSVKVANNRFISFSSLKFGALYQYLINDISDFQKLGDRLIQEASKAQAFRHTKRIEELGIVLSNIPIKEYKLIGQYYTGWASYLKGERPREIFEKVAEQSQRYKAKGLISLAVIEAHRGDYTSELAYYNEALKCADNPSTKVDILRAIATVKAKEGFNKQSLRDLEKAWPLIRYSELKVRHDYLNSYAVELIEAGRIEEASNISRIVLASPFAFAYPEWRETGQELVLRGYQSRSVVSALKPVLDNVVPLPVVESSPSPVQRGRARVLSYAKWKKKMVKKPNGDTDNDKNVDDMTEQDMVLELIGMLTGEEADENKLRKLLKSAIKIFSEK